MGFTQLLAANRSLRNINSGPSRYKMNQANLLPKFGAEKSSKREGLALLPEPAAAEPQAIPAATLATPSAGAAAARPDQRRIEMQSTLNQTVKTQNASAPSSRTAGWLRFRNPFGARPGKAQTVAAVQTELVLGTVKPVRNELGDEEFTSEARVATVPGPTPMHSPFAPAVIRSDKAPGLLRRWKERVFGSRGHRPQG